MIDDLIIEFDKGLKVLFAKPKGSRPRPDLHIEDAELTPDEKKTHGRIDACKPYR